MVGPVGRDRSSTLEQPANSTRAGNDPAVSAEWRKVAPEYRTVAASDQRATDRPDRKDVATEIFNWFLPHPKKLAQHESPSKRPDAQKASKRPEAQKPLEGPDAQKRVPGTSTAPLRGTTGSRAPNPASGNDRVAAPTNHTSAGTVPVNVKLNVEVSKLNDELSNVPAGPNGSHTLDQWIEAAKKLEHKDHVTADQRQVIESIAKFGGYMDQIQHNPDSLNLTPDEWALAQKDLPTLAFVKAAGTTLNLNDPNLPPEMLQIAKQVPALFAVLQRKRVNIWTDWPVNADTAIGQLPGGQFLHVTVDGKPVSKAEISNLVQWWSKLHGENSPLAVAYALIPNLHVENDASLQALMKASDTARMQYAEEPMKALTSASNPDPKAALSFLNTQRAGFFNESARDAFWSKFGKPYFSKEFFHGQIDKLLQMPDRRDRSFYRESLNTERKADKVGRYMQDILKDAPPEVVRPLLEAVTTDFSKEWYQANHYGSIAGPPPFKEFYKGLSMAIEMDPTRAREVALWLTDRNGPQANTLLMLRNPPSGGIFEGVRNAISEGYGSTLSVALDDNENFPNDFRLDFNRSLQEGSKNLKSEIEKKNSIQDYTDFMKDPDKALKPFFQSFSKDQNIGHEIAYTYKSQEIAYENNTQWRNIIGRNLGLTPNTVAGQQAADANDYSVDWYQKDSPEITLVTNWLHLRGAEEPGTKVTAVPFKYASKIVGVQTAGLFLIDKPGLQDHDPNNQEVIDGGAALEAVYGNGGHALDDAQNVKVFWHYNNFAQFQTDNRYDPAGYLFLPRDPHLDGYNNDRKTRPGGYQQFTAHIKTAGEKVQEIARPAVRGTGLALVLTGQEWAGIPLVLLAAGDVGISAHRLYNMQSHGESIRPTNGEALSEWMAVGGIALAGFRSGMLAAGAGQGRLAWLANSRLGRAANSPLGRGVTSVAGGAATVTGLEQTAEGAVSTVRVLSDPNASAGEMALSLADLALGAALVRGGTVRIGAQPPPVPTPRTFGWRGVQITGRLGALYVRMNVAGLGGWAIANFFRNDRRTTAPITDANRDAELTKYWNNPGKYVELNYEPTLFGQSAPTLFGHSAPWAGYEGNGHLREYTGTNGSVFFRRVPQDLFEAIVKEAQGSTNVPSSPAAMPPSRPPALTPPAPAQKPPPVQNVPPGSRVPAPAQPAKPKRRGGTRLRSSDRPARNAHRVANRRKIRRAERKPRWRGMPPAWSRPEGKPGRRHRRGSELDRALERCPIGLNHKAARTVGSAKRRVPTRVGAAARRAPLRTLPASGQSAAVPATARAPSAAVPATAPASVSPGASKPWILAPADPAKARPFLQDGKPYIYERIDVSKTGEYRRSTDAALAKLDPKSLGQLPDEFKQAIGVYGFMSYLKRDKPQGMAAAPLWGQAEQKFQGLTGTGAYDGWANARRPVTGDNVYWQQARTAADLKSQIAAQADALWKAAGRHGSGPTLTQKEQAEWQSGPQIATRAYELWLLGGRKPGTVGADDWKKGEPAFQEQIGTPAFDSWVSKGKGAPVQGVDSSWRDAILKWEKDGRPIVAKVEIRQPYKDEKNRGFEVVSHASDGPGSFRDRRTFGYGPPEGWSINYYDEIDRNYCYSAYTQTTARYAFPTPDLPLISGQGPGGDVRQQDSTILRRDMFGVGTIGWNGGATGLQVYDLTDGTQNSWTAMNARFYWDVGYRNRTRIDLTGRIVNDVHQRETGFSEWGFGLDGFKYNFSSDHGFNFNLYAEAQLYGPDLRGVINFRNPRFITNTAQLMAPPRRVFFDIAGQFTIINPDWRLIHLPVSCPVR